MIICTYIHRWIIPWVDITYLTNTALRSLREGRERQVTAPSGRHRFWNSSVYIIISIGTAANLTDVFSSLGISEITNSFLSSTHCFEISNSFPISSQRTSAIHHWSTYGLSVRRQTRVKEKNPHLDAEYHEQLYLYSGSVLRLRTTLGGEIWHVHVNTIPIYIQQYWQRDIQVEPSLIWQTWVHWRDYIDTSSSSKPCLAIANRFRLRRSIIYLSYSTEDIQQELGLIPPITLVPKVLYSFFQFPCRANQ